MTDDEYRERAWAIERAADCAIARVRRAFPVIFPARRSARYAGGMADAIAEIATADDVEAIRDAMGDALDALDIEFYGLSDEELTI